MHIHDAYIYTLNICMCLPCARKHVGRFDDEHVFAVAVAHLSIGTHSVRCRFLLLMSTLEA